MKEGRKEGGNSFSFRSVSYIALVINKHRPLSDTDQEVDWILVPLIRILVWASPPLIAGSAVIGSTAESNDRGSFEQSQRFFLLDKRHVLLLGLTSTQVLPVCLAFVLCRGSADVHGFSSSGRSRAESDSLKHRSPPLGIHKAIEVPEKRCLKTGRTEETTALLDGSAGPYFRLLPAVCSGISLPFTPIEICCCLRSPTLRVYNWQRRQSSGGDIKRLSYSAPMYGVEAHETNVDGATDYRGPEGQNSDQ